MSTLFVEPDAHDNPALWAENLSEPILVATKHKLKVSTTYGEFTEIVWHAATAVLAPSDEQIDVAARAMFEGLPATYASWDGASKTDREAWRSSAREALAALAAHTEGAAT